MISPFLPLKLLLSKCTISFVTCTLVYYKRERPGHVTWLSQHESHSQCLPSKCQAKAY
jgi:hypothetical protein